MAGSYMHIVTDTGRLRSNERVVRSLETGGDVFEAVEEMYGMIWWLAAERVNYGRVGIESIAIESDEDRLQRFDLIKEEVEKARQNYKDGLGFANAIHGASPDKRRD